MKKYANERSRLMREWEESRSEKRTLELMTSADWRMKWEILPGIFTPGTIPYDPKYILDQFGIPEDLQGKNAIDVGTWDGAIAFELEKRGARTIATDIQDPDATAFSTAHRILLSSVSYVQASVYDLPKVLKEEMDIVVFRGVFYHLKNPIGAFEAIGQIMSSDALLFTEGECLLYYAETLENEPVLTGIDEIANSKLPLTLCYPGTYKRGENWFIPNMACFKSWMQAAGLEMIHSRLWEDRGLKPYPGQRIIAVIQKKGSPVAEHSLLKRGWSGR